MLVLGKGTTLYNCISIFLGVGTGGDPPPPRSLSEKGSHLPEKTLQRQPPPSHCVHDAGGGGFCVAAAEETTPLWPNVCPTLAQLVCWKGAGLGEGGSGHEQLLGGASSHWGQLFPPTWGVATLPFCSERTFDG